MFGEDCPAHIFYLPRPDAPARFDQQTSFIEEKLAGVAFCVGGNGAGCLHRDQIIFDPVLNISRKVSEIDSDFHVWAIVADGRVVVSPASRPKVYGVEKLYRVGLSNGRTLMATMGHRVWTGREWREIGDILREGGTVLLPCCDGPSLNQSLVYIISVDFIAEEEYWDFSVPVHENYWCEGIWNHNTTTSALIKVSRFLMEQKPPRHDTPFWIISDSYGQVCDVAWKEKLWNNQILPREEIDESRITWRNRNKQHPDTVPLKPWPDDPSVNWVLHFKSYSQGRQEFQAASIGGFCFIEQFPWDLLTETIARCRDYFFPGSMIAEFTPIDPNLSMTIQEMQENGHPPENPDPKKKYLPKGWKVYRANTACAMEHGHVSTEWFDQFFGSMGEAERAVRMMGAWADFEGAIYQSFNPLIHGITLDEIYANDGDFPLNVQHRRAIDWGFSAEHAFVCLWGYWEPSTHDWVIYDEYWSVDQKLTVHDHLCLISDRWDWPRDGHHGMSYADPSRQDHIRIAGRLNEYQYTDPKTGEKRECQPIILQNASNSVYEGIDHVRSLLTINPSTGKPRLRICKETCPYLWRQMQTYRWVRGTDSGLNPRAGRPEPLKIDDDAVDALRYLVFSDAKKMGMSIQQQAVQHESTARRLTLYRRGSGLR